MRETGYRSLVAQKIHNDENTVVEELQLRYEIGNYKRGKTFGMPDVFLDLVEMDKKGSFHLYELKMLNANDLWNGKFLGQILLYRFLFGTEHWNELAGRFAMKANSNPSLVHGDIGSILIRLGSYGDGEVYREGDRFANFKSASLVVCGGKGYELAAGYNPIIWSFWVDFSEILKSVKLDFNIYHAYFEGGSIILKSITDISVNGSLTPGAAAAFEKETK